MLVISSEIYIIIQNRYYKKYLNLNVGQHRVFTCHFHRNQKGVDMDHEIFIRSTATDNITCF